MAGHYVCCRDFMNDQHQLQQLLNLSDVVAESNDDVGIGFQLLQGLARRDQTFGNGFGHHPAVEHLGIPFVVPLSGRKAQVITELQKLNAATHLRRRSCLVELNQAAHKLPDGAIHLAVNHAGMISSGSSQAEEVGIVRDDHTTFAADELPLCRVALRAQPCFQRCADLNAVVA